MPPRKPTIERIGNQQRVELKEYGKKDLDGLLQRFHRMLMDLVENRPNLKFVQEEIESRLRQNGDPMEDIRNSYAGIIEALISLEHILDPQRVQQATTHGRFASQTKEGVGVTLTDVRGFTGMTRNLKKRGISVASVLKNTYFPSLIKVLDKHQLHYSNYTGDGLLAYSEVRIDGIGRPLLPALDNTILADAEAVSVTESIAEAWKRDSQLRLFMKGKDGEILEHETGFGLAYGDVQILDPLVTDEDVDPLFKEFNETFRKIAIRRAPEFEPKFSTLAAMRSCHTIGEPVNEAARMQDIDKDLPDHTLIMSAETVAHIHTKAIRDLFEMNIATREPKGLGRPIQICGIQRGRQIDIAKLMQQAYSEAAAQPYARSADKAKTPAKRSGTRKAKGRK